MLLFELIRSTPVSAATVGNRFIAAGVAPPRNWAFPFGSSKQITSFQRHAKHSDDTYRCEQSENRKGRSRSVPLGGYRKNDYG
jgi:hypothetical protein